MECHYNIYATASPKPKLAYNNHCLYVQLIRCAPIICFLLVYCRSILGFYYILLQYSSSVFQLTIFHIHDNLNGLTCTTIQRLDQLSLFPQAQKPSCNIFHMLHDFLGVRFEEDFFYSFFSYEVEGKSVLPLPFLLLCKSKIEEVSRLMCDEIKFIC